MSTTLALASDPSLTPMMPPPPGVTSNLTNPISRAPAVIIANAVITAVMLLFVLARLCAKFAFARSQLGWDDVFCVAGTFISSVLFGLGTFLLHSGLGIHAWDIRLDYFLEKMDTVIRGTKAVNIFYGIAMIFTKLSILFLYFRLFRISRRARVLIYIGIVSTVLIHVVGTILNATAGNPSDPSSVMRYVSRVNAIQLGVTVVNVVGDFYILLLPLIEILHLQLTRTRKLGVLAVFSTGLLACLVGIAGVVLRIVSWPGTDCGWDAALLMVAMLYEINIGLIVGCMPVLPLFVKHADDISRFSSYLRSLPSRFLSSCGSYAGDSKIAAMASRDIHSGPPHQFQGGQTIPRIYLRLKEHDGPIREPASVV